MILGMTYEQWDRVDRKIGIFVGTEDIRIWMEGENVMLALSHPLYGHSLQIIHPNGTVLSC